MVKKAIQKAMKNLKGSESKSTFSSLSNDIACEEETEVNEFAQVDVVLHKTSKSDNAQNQLEKLESCIQDHEEGLERLFRQMIKTRVSFLNILNH
ncbi:unnamed protein product [Malus baccata var. baccata]